MKQQEGIVRVRNLIGEISDETRLNFIKLVTGTNDRSYDIHQKFPILNPEADGDNWVTSARVLMPYLSIDRMCLPLLVGENVVEGVVSYTRPKIKEWMILRVGENTYWDIRTHYTRPRDLDCGLVYDPKAKKENVLITDDLITWINETYQNYSFCKNKHAVLIVGDHDKALGMLANYSWFTGREETIFRRK